MRSKRKEVNKYTFKAVEEAKDGEGEDSIQRSSGIKPFQLVKVRQGQRSSFDLAHVSNQMLHRRAGSNNLYNDEKDIYLDLIIKQKLIVDAQVNQKLQSERKNIISMQRQSINSTQNQLRHHNSDLKQVVGEEEQQIYNETEEPYCIQTSHQPEETSKIYEHEAIPQRHKKSKCQCCLQLNATNAIFRHKNEENCFNAQTEEREGSSEEMGRANEEARQELKAMKQKALPPFSFTSTKWRSKSETLQVDKWKQKYGKESHQSQKLLAFEKAVSMTKFDKRKIKTNEPNNYSSESQKFALPILHKSRQLQSKAKIFKFSPTKREEKQVIKIYNPESEFRSNYLLLNHENFKKQKKSNQMLKKNKENEERIEIAIKKMYDTQVEQAPKEPQNIENAVEEATAPLEKQKNKRKKSKFPEIQISTFYSSKEQEDERRRIRMENIQKLTRQWRYNPPKKVYMEKMMEQIPERWEYGESRDSSRQVDTYMQHQQEEAKREQHQKEMEEKRLQQELQMHVEEYLSNAQVVVRQ